VRNKGKEDLRKRKLLCMENLISVFMSLTGSGFSTCRMMCWIQCTVCSSTPTTTTTAYRSTLHLQSILIILSTSSLLADSSLWCAVVSLLVS